MNPWIKRTGIGLGLLALAGATLVGAGWFAAEHKLHRQVEVKAYPLLVRQDAPILARGQYLFNSRGCAECHGGQGQGHIVIQDDNGMLIKSPSIHPGVGTVVAHYTASDWERAIRHGIKPSGEPLMIMPSDDYNRMTDQDLAALVAYLGTLPAQAGTPATIQLPLPVKVLYGLGAIEDAAQRIDHALPPSPPVPEGITPQHGQYVAQMCMGCHGAQFSGGKIPGSPPQWPAAANLTPGEGSVMPRYATAEAFLTMMRTGHRPDGSEVSKVMPFETLKNLSDTDARALYAYLHTLAPMAAGQR